MNNKSIIIVHHIEIGTGSELFYKIQSFFLFYKSLIINTSLFFRHRDISPPASAPKAVNRKIDSHCCFKAGQESYRNSKETHTGNLREDKQKKGCLHRQPYG